MRLNYQANRQIAGKKIPSLWGKNWDEIGVFVAYYYSYSKISHLLRAHYRETVFFNHVAHKLLILVYNPCICTVQLKTTQLHIYEFKLYLFKS